MAWPVTINGRTWTQADFAGLNYVAGIPDLAEAIVTYVTNGWSATSTTNLTIGVGAKTLTVQANKPFGLGQPLRIASTADPTKYMDGAVTAYNQATGSLTVNVGVAVGAGTFAAWTVTMGGARIAGSVAPLPVAEGGTGGTTGAQACANLGALPTAGGTVTGDVTFGRAGFGTAAISSATVAVKYDETAVAVNATNHRAAVYVSSNFCPVGAGVTDSGSRYGVRSSIHLADPNFVGTLNSQLGLYAQYGHYAGCGAGTVNNAYGLYIEYLSSGAANVVNAWGVYQPSAAARNYFAGNVGVGTSSPTANAGGSTIAIGGSTNAWCELQVGGTVYGRLWTSNALTYLEAVGASQVLALRTNGTTRLRVAAAGAIEAGTDNTQTLGTSAYRWSVVYAGTGTINTSDARQKQVRGPLTEAEIRAWARVQPTVYRWLDAVAAKGDQARLHAGYIAQAVRDAFAAEGLDAARYGLWCADPEIETVEEVVTELEQAVEAIETTEEVIEVEDGRAVLRLAPCVVERPVWRTLPVVDADGQPVIEEIPAEVDEETGEVIRPAQRRQRYHQEPVMVEVPRTRTVERPRLDAAGQPIYRLGLRYDQCLVFEAAYQRARVAALEARLQAAGL